jgi:hypothetical protein
MRAGQDRTCPDNVPFCPTFPMPGQDRTKPYRVVCLSVWNQQQRDQHINRALLTLFRPFCPRLPAHASWGASGGVAMETDLESAAAH